jgi:SAM-dependent methyltransferase
MQALETSTARAFLPGIVEEYVRNRPLFFALIRPQEAAMFRSLQMLLRPPVLDFGCGDGFFARVAFPGRTLDVGLDLEDSREEEAQGSGVYEEVTTYGGRAVPYPDNSFGTVVSNCVLEHVGDVSAAVVEVFRVLKPGGYFLTSVMADKWEEHQLGAKVLGDRYRRFMRRRQVHRNLLSESEWNTVFTAAGFKVVSATGYLGHRSSMYMDALHYLSAPSLATRALFGKWVVLPGIWAFLTKDILTRAIEFPVAPSDSSAIFYVLKKAA